MLFTIFTPTYNRAYILPVLYNSLVRQCSKNFEWLIVDDGSTDNTAFLINEFIEEKKIPIRYFKQKNQGKHIAINTALELAESPWFCTIDSDDSLESRATKIWEKLTKETTDEEVAGFSFIHFSSHINYDQSKYGMKRFSQRKEYAWEFPGEMIYCFKTEIARKFPFPVFSDENFCQESVVLRPLFRKFKVLFTDYVLARGEYLPDGLSQNHYASMIKNPKYGLLSIKEYLLDAETTSEKIYLTKVYWDIVIKSQKIPIYKAINGIPIIYTIEIFTNKLVRKILGLINV